MDIFKAKTDSAQFPRLGILDMEISQKNVMSEGSAKLQEFITANHPKSAEDGGKEIYWSVSHITNSQIIFNPKSSGGLILDEYQPLALNFPEPVYRLPIPDWAKYTNEWGSYTGDKLTSKLCFKSEVEALIKPFLDKLQAFYLTSQK